MSTENAGSGPHPTMAGNRYDPAVSGNGPAATTSGSTAGPEGQNVHRNGIEYIKDQVGMGSGSTITTGSTGTNPGGDGASGGLSSGAGGASGAADAGASSQSEGGLLDTVKSYLGVGGAEGEQTGSRSTSGVTGSEASTSERHQSTGGRMDERQGSAAQQGEERREAREERREEKQEGDGAVKKTGGGTGNLENKDAIPTAGGERLGEKHWGESKIVPENPKPAEGTASEDGQPDSETKDNTARNARDGNNDDGEKEGKVDKIKHKLHMG